MSNINLYFYNIIFLTISSIFTYKLKLKKCPVASFPIRMVSNRIIWSQVNNFSRTIYNHGSHLQTFIMIPVYEAYPAQVWQSHLCSIS